MKILSVIPARGGSKRLPGKNLRKLDGKPLIGYSIEASLASELVNDTVVSTDDLTIAQCAGDLGAKVIFRPSELAADTSLVIDAMRHVVRTLEMDGLTYDYMVLLEPTSPMRRAVDIDDTIKLVISKNADSGATFSETSTPPNRIWRIENSNPTPFIVGSNPFLPSQDHMPGFYLNGMVYVIKVPELMKTSGNSILIGKQVASIIPSDRVVDIDTIKDLRYAEFLISNFKDKL
jgi:CMP-N,N'-diacetyllegionaminic acid synthase